MSEGARAMEVAYNALEKRVGGTKGRQLWRRVLKNSFAQMIKEAKSLTPKNTGRLSRSIQVWPGDRRTQEFDFFRVNFGYRNTKAKTRPFIHQMLAVEYGTKPGGVTRTGKRQFERKTTRHKGIPAYAPVRMAFERSRVDIIETMRRGLFEEVEKINRELASDLRTFAGA